MKLLTITLIILISGTVILGTLFVITTNKQPVELGYGNVENNFLITQLQKAVFLKLPKQTEFTELLTENTTASGGSTIKTSIAGRALVEFSKEALTVVDRNSEFTITTNQNQGNKTAIVLHSGNLWSRIQKVLEQDQYHEIETSNTVAAVRGTSFGISFNNKVTSVVVANGTVSVTAIDPITGNRILETETFVSPETMAIIENGDITLSNIPASLKNSEWYQFNTDKESKRQDIISQDVVPTKIDEPRALPQPSLPPEPIPIPSPSQTFQEKTVSPQESQAFPACRATGCNGQVCADEEVVTTCEWRPEYQCYKTARCERQPDGKCGWTQTEELSKCLNNNYNTNNYNTSNIRYSDTAKYPSPQ